MLTLPYPTALMSLFTAKDESTLQARPSVTRWLAFGVADGRTRELPRAHGRMVVHCRQGSVWITHDGDPRDVVLQENESYSVDCAQRMTAHAMHGDCGLELQVDA